MNVRRENRNSPRLWAHAGRFWIVVPLHLETGETTDYTHAEHLAGAWSRGRFAYVPAEDTANGIVSELDIPETELVETLAPGRRPPGAVENDQLAEGPRDPWEDAPAEVWAAWEAELQTVDAPAFVPAAAGVAF